MKIAYADPPYIGQAKKKYGDHPDYAGEVDHAELIRRLDVEYPEGWALSCHVPSLKVLLPLVQDPHRVLAWGKSFCAWKRGVYPAYAWEPVIMRGGRPAYGTRQTPRDFLLAPVTLMRGVAGAKPQDFCFWLFDCLGLEPGDELHDLFPGSGAVAHAWDAYCAQMPLAFPSEPETDPMFTEEVA